MRRGAKMAYQTRTKKKERVLSEDALERLLERLDGARDRAEQKYQTIRRKLIKYFDWRGCGFPEDLADETLYRVAAQIGEGLVIRSSEPSVYFRGVARNVLHEYWEKPEREMVDLDGLAEFERPSFDPREQERRADEKEQMEARLECLDRCRQKLPPETDDLLQLYYEGEGRDRIETRNQIAARLNISMNTLRIRVCRVKEDLKSCVENCLGRTAGLK
jgi:RNA polymerase sigma factor (sigma-70 family)